MGRRETRRFLKTAGDNMLKTEKRRGGFLCPVLFIVLAALLAAASCGASAARAPALGTKISDYVSFRADTLYFYEGKGHALATYYIYNTIISPDGKKMQRLLLSGVEGYDTQTETFQITDGRLTLTYGDTFYYHFEDRTGVEQAQPMLLLREPLKVGESWSVSPGVISEVTRRGVKVETPSGTYRALEVTTSYGDGFFSKDYYAPGVGVVKTSYAKAGEAGIESSLAKITEKTSVSCPYYLFYPEKGTGDLIISNETCPLTTNYDLLETANAVLTTPPSSGGAAALLNGAPLIGLEFSFKDGAVTANFSEAVYARSYASATDEDANLSAVALTLGKLFGADYVYIRVNGGPYAGKYVKKSADDFYSANLSG